MYKPTIWQDHVEGVQEGTDMNAENFNNIEVGVMEASALAALMAEKSRASQNSEILAIYVTLTSTKRTQSVPIPKSFGKRFDYNVIPVLEFVDYLEEEGDTNAGDIIISDRVSEYFTITYTGTSPTIGLRVYVTGGVLL